MWPLLLLVISSALAQELDLSSIQALQDKLPADNRMEQPPFDPRNESKHRPPVRITHWEKIKKSGNELGAIEGGVPIIRIEDNKGFTASKPIYVRYYLLEDEYGFKYLIDQDGETTFKIDTKYVEPIKKELALYVPPEKYTPAPLNIAKTVYDKKLRILPEGSLYLGHVMGDYMKDLFNDDEAKTGFSTQYGLHVFTGWKLPIKAGAAIHYEKTTYGLTGGGQVNYNSLSFGPQFKTRDLEFSNLLYRLQVQLRVSPFASALAETATGSILFKFNSTDLLASLEHPLKNSWGEFVFGAFLQAQWLNIKDQPEPVRIRASNKTNTSLGFSVAQVFD